MSRPAVPRLAGALAVALGVLAACDGATEPRIPAIIEIAAGDGQSGTVGTVLPVPTAVRVLTADGKPVRNVPVTFTVTGGGGTISAANATTDRTGTAQAVGWTLGTLVGENLLTAGSGTLASATIRATATADQPAGMQVAREPAAATSSGAPLPTQPIVQLVDRFNNASAQAGITVTAAVVEGTATVANGSAVTGPDGIATFTGLALSAPAGSYTLEFQAPGITSRRAAGAILVGTGICGDAGAGALTLDLATGQLQRFQADAPNAPVCLAFELSRAAGHQYLLLFENMPLNGRYDGGVFNELPVSSSSFNFSVTGTPSSVTPAGALAARRQLAFPVPDEDVATHEWDFGDGVIHEGKVGPLPADDQGPVLLRKGVALSLMAAATDPQVGDTVLINLEGISRLDIPTGQQKAVVRYLSDHIIFAEDVRLGTTLLREGSTPEAPLYNTPLTQADMDAIALEYASYARVQGDILFENRHNRAVETASPTNRVLAVHTLMYANNIWGYTYSASQYFAFDYWVGTNGSTKQNAQHPQRLADDLFMHEIAHMRHYGMLERAGRTGQRGNQWLVEGFARFTERLPIAHRLLGAVAPSRTANVVLPRNPAFGNAYYFDDVPTYLQAGAAMFGGYGASSFVFDYFIDMVALRGADQLLAIRDFVLNAGTRANLDAAVNRWLPDVTSFGELFTRSRIALYTDDYGTPLPAWEQYQQYQLRASRPPGSQTPSDPRNAWLKVVPGQPFSTELTDLVPGSARGLLIDGSAATGSTRIAIEAPHSPNGVISVARIR
jgi:hypothetical protein